VTGASSTGGPSATEVLLPFQILSFIGFALAMFLFYSTVPIILKVETTVLLQTYWGG
jgi:hypothetical protein